MRFTRLHIPDELARQYELNGFTMDRLDKVVILAGKNGAGKSRILNLLATALSWNDSRMTNEDAKRIIQQTEETIKGFEKTLIEQPNNENIKRQLLRTRNSIKETLLKAAIFEGSEEIYVGGPRETIKFIPLRTSLTDPMSITNNDRKYKYEAIKKPGMTSIAESSLSYILEVFERHFTVTHQAFKGAEDEKRIRIAEFETLDDLIYHFLGTRITLADSRFEANIFGKPLGQARLSEGQSVLLQLCIAIHAQGGAIGNFILVLDEPENHLHPEVLIRVIDKIAEKIGTGQLWIATHSVHLLAHFDPSVIHFVENGDVTFGGRNPEKVLRSLLGDENEIYKLANFLSLPDQIAFNLFSQQCLTDPEVLLTGKHDPQVKQIHKLLLEKATSGQKLRVLDLGMGKGRLLATLTELAAEKGESIANKIDYFGFDVSKEHKDECEKLLANFFMSAKGRYFNSRSELNDQIEPEYFDVIIMCNVLHEIPPEQWVDVFSSPSSIFKRLNGQGTLLIVEDQLIPIGENPHPKGYLVLNPDQMRTLFKTSSSKGYNVFFEDNRKRLAAHMIPASDISNVSVETVVHSLTLLKGLAQEKIKEIRASGNTSFAAGRANAFWVHQLANATLALSVLSGPTVVIPHLEPKEA